jgi:hypothetical protein
VGAAGLATLADCDAFSDSDGCEEDEEVPAEAGLEGSEGVVVDVDLEGTELCVTEAAGLEGKDGGVEAF